MQEILHALETAVASGKAVVYCRLVETRGSTPQKAGAAMLVFADGSQAGTLGGGCVEAEVKRRALERMSLGKPEILKFKLDSDYGWDDGLICGGRMMVLVDPLTGAENLEYFSKLRTLAASSEGCCEVISFDPQQSGIPQATSYLFDGQGELAAVLGQTGEATGAVPQTVRNVLPALADRPRPSAQAGLSILPILPRCRLLIVGAGHVGQAVGALAVDLDFDVWVVDDRAVCASEERFPGAQRLIVGDIDQVLPEVEITPSTYCLIVTRGHNHDEEALFHVIDRGAAYVGLIGSKRKIKLIFEDLLAEGVSAESLTAVYAPLGIDIGSQTVPEIAVSIAAELVSHRNRGGVVPGRPDSICPTRAEHA